MTPRRALAKLRARVRREASDNESQHEGGELNLVPYLDIVTNTVIFMLATVAIGMMPANISAAAPKYTPNPDPVPGKAPAHDWTLAITVSERGFIVAGEGGVLPTIGCKSGATRCRARPMRRRDPRLDVETLAWVDDYDYAELAKVLRQLKTLHPNKRRVHVGADRQVPYQVLVRTLDIVRGQRTARCTGADGCLFDRVVFIAGVE